MEGGTTHGSHGSHESGRQTLAVDDVVAADVNHSVHHRCERR